MSDTTPRPPAKSSSAPDKGNWITWVLVAAVVGLIGINIAYVVMRDGDGTAQVDEEAPDFTLPLFEASAELGDEVELSDLRGKTVVLEFWATTCSACRTSFPVIEALHREGQDDVVVLTVNTEGRVAAVRRYFEQFGYSVPVAMDNGSVSRAYGVDAIPKTVIVAADGKIASIHTGAMSARQLRAQLDDARD